MAIDLSIILLIFHLLSINNKNKFQETVTIIDSTQLELVSQFVFFIYFCYTYAADYLQPADQMQPVLVCRS